MILKEINLYIKDHSRVSEASLLQHFHLREAGLIAMMAILLKRGKIKKTVHQRGVHLPAEVYYSYVERAEIPMVSLL